MVVGECSHKASRLAMVVVFGVQGGVFLQPDYNGPLVRTTLTGIMTMDDNLSLGDMYWKHRLGTEFFSVVN